MVQPLSQGQRASISTIPPGLGPQPLEMPPLRGPGPATPGTAVAGSATQRRSSRADTPPTPVHILAGPDLRRQLAQGLSSATFAPQNWRSVEAFLLVLPRLAGGCVIVDVRESSDAIDALRERLSGRQYEFPIVAIAARADVQCAVRLMKAGALDVLEAPVTPAALNEALRAALDRLPAGDATANSAARFPDQLSQLTPRETQVLRYILACWPGRSIAADLAISPRTVEVYRANIMKKLRARNLSELMRVAFEAGLL